MEGSGSERMRWYQNQLWCQGAETSGPKGDAPLGSLRQWPGMRDPPGEYPVAAESLCECMAGSGVARGPTLSKKAQILASAQAHQGGPAQPPRTGAEAAGAVGLRVALWRPSLQTRDTLACTH